MDEAGVVLADFDPDGLPLEVLDCATPTTVCSRFIDPYGDTVFNQLQLPVLILEFRRMVEGSDDTEFCRRMRAVIQFLTESEGVHQYVRFVGD